MKKIAFGLYAAVSVALLIWGYYQAIYVAPSDAMQGEISRIIYYHVPHASLSFIFFGVSLIGSIGFLALRRSQPERAQLYDAWALSGAEIGVVFCTIALITGPIWTPGITELISCSMASTIRSESPTAIRTLAAMHRCPAQPVADEVTFLAVTTGSASGTTTK